MSFATTVPDTSRAPSPDACDGSGGDFARLVATSPLARKQFDAIVEKMLAQPEYQQHARRYMHWEPRVASGSGSASPSTSASEADNPDADAGIKWTGHYRLNFDIPPHNPGLGWVLGSSRPRLAETDVDMLLTAEPGRFGVGGRHFRLRHNAATGALLLLTSRHRVTAAGTHLLSDSSLVIFENTTVVVKDLIYELQFTDLDPAVYRRQLDKLRPRMCPDAPSALQPTLTPTPLGQPYRYDDYVVYPAVVGGVSGTVSEGHHAADGHAVAVKKIRRDNRNAHQVNNEIALLKRINHQNICTLEKVVYAAGEDRHDRAFFPGNELDEVVLFITPVAETTLVEYINAPLSRQSCRDLACQVLSAVAYLHANGIMHRDVKPANIGVLVEPSLKAVLLDFGHSIKALQSDDHYAGTIRYLSPEVIALKEGRSKTPYTQLVDIWALGLTMYEVFTSRRVSWQRVSHTGYSNLLEHLESHEVDLPMVQALKRMLCWSSSTRAQAQEALDLLEENKDVDEMPAKRRQTEKFSRRINPALFPNQ